MASEWDDFEKELLKEFKSEISSNNKNSKELFNLVINKEEITKLADKLKEYIKRHIQYYFDTYQAVTARGYGWKYKDKSYYYGGRTGQLVDSVLVEIDGDSNSLVARVHFDENKIYRKSLFNQGRGNVLDLLNDGYRVSKGWHKDIHHFGYFEGARFLEAAIMDAKKNPKFSIVDIVYEPKGNYRMEL